MTTASNPRGCHRARVGNDSAAMSDAPDTLAPIIEPPQKHKLLPIYKRLEEELEAPGEADEIMSRVLKPIKQQSSKGWR